MIHLHVLLVDDETDMRQTVEAALTLDPFFIVRDCACGAEALTAAVAWRPDLILLDVIMPDMDGPMVVTRLRADKRTVPIPVVFLTARWELRERRRCTALGAIGAIVKPFDPMALAGEVRRFVPLESSLSPAREGFLRRLEADACALFDCRNRLMQTRPAPALVRINEIAQSLAGASGIYGFAGITCASAALSDAAANNLAGRAKPIEVERALDRLLERIASN
jgi:CheY-like chemotaxis protein